MFQCREYSVAFPFINALAPHVVMILNNMCVDKPTREDQLTVTLEAIKIMEILVDLTEDHLSMFFCFLIHFFKISDRCRYSRLVDNPLDLYLVIVLKQWHNGSCEWFTVHASYEEYQRSTYGDRAFSAAAPRLWNQLPPEHRGVTSVDQFRTQLKTYLFKLAYDVWF